MIKVCDALSHFENLYKNHTVYLQGARCEEITLQLCNKLYINAKSSKYNKKYYQNKYNECKDKIGADPAGSFYPISGFLGTAQTYYDRCVENGSIASLPKDKPCLVFKGKSISKITHIGFYTGTGMVVEMSEKNNCVKNKIDGNGWQWYGVPDWIDYSEFVYHEKFTPYLAKTTDGMNLRSTPSSTYRTNVITSVPKDTYVYVSDYSIGAWVKVHTVIFNEEYIGYMCQNYLEPINTKDFDKRQVKFWRLNAFTGRKLFSPTVFTMKKNDIFTVITKDKQGLILYDNKLGYANVSNAYSKKL